MNLNPVGNTWQRLVYRIAGDDHRDFITLIFGWQKIVGKLLAERTELIKLDNNVLFVSVLNNVWMQELVLHKKRFIDEVESVLQIKLQDIIFYLGRKTEKRKKKC